jgi:hypothetical protein
LERNQQLNVSKKKVHINNLKIDNFFVSVDVEEDVAEHSPEAEPMDLDDEVSPTKSNIIEVNAPAVNTKAAGPSSSRSDPRLRSRKQTPLPSLPGETGGEPQLAAMTADELMTKARQQMAALAKMEQTQTKPGGKIKIEWKKKPRNN